MGMLLLNVKRGVGMIGLALSIAGCATNQPKSDAIIVGEDVCGGEAARVYFAHGESVLSPLAAQVVVRLQDQLVQCPKRRIVLVSISDDDGPPTSLETREERAAIVRQILVSRGVAENRITATAQGPLIDQAPKGPIGGVLIFTRP